MKKLIVLLIAFFCLLTIGLAARPAAAIYDPFSVPCTSSGQEGSVCNDKNKPQNQNSNIIYGNGSLLAKVITILDIVIGVLAVITIIIAGLRFVLSGGESHNVSGARNAVLYAVVGLVVAASAQLVVIFVLSRL